MPTAKKGKPKAKKPKTKKAKTKKAKTKKATLKTKPNAASVSAFLNGVEDAERRKDAKAVARLMKAATGAKPKMWGGSIVGYGEWEYTYASGRSGDWFEVGFSPRKANLVLYLLACGADFSSHLRRLGPHKRGKGCLYIKRLSDVDLEVLEEMIDVAVAARRSP